MHFGNDKARPLASGRRRAFHPVAQALEDRLVMAVDLASYATAPLGVLMAGNIGGAGAGPATGNGGGAGYSVADVGDVNGDGYADFVVGGPTIAVNTSGLFELGSGSNGTAYLVFGSRQVNSPQNIDFASLNANQRTGDLGTLGNATQTNPLNGTPGFAFDGITFRAGQQTLGQLGASVTALGDINGDGLADFMIGAPGAAGANGITAGFGRAYLVYGSRTMAVNANKSVDLDNVQPTSGLNVITFIGSQANGRAGRAVAGVGDVIPNGLPDIAIGAPFASINGVSGSGAVYVIDGAFLRPARTQTVNLADVGQPSGAAQSGLSNQNSIVFGGANPGSEAGTAIAGAGDFDKDGKADLLIGAASGSTGGAGAAYLIYGAGNLTTQSIAPPNGVFSINLSRLGNGTGTTDIRGAVFTGITGDIAGFALSTAGDFNNDGVSDILIGSPGFLNNTGRVSLIYGSAATPATPGAIEGTFPLNALPDTINHATFIGQGPNSLAGYSVSEVGRINADQINEIAFGAPGVNSGSGAVYLIPGNPNLLSGTITLNVAGIEIPSIAGQTITLSQPVGQNFLGTSVSGRLSAGGRTIDNDTIGDLVLGSAGYALNSTRGLAGAGFAVEGRFLQLGIPVSTAITSDISVGTSVNPPYVVNAKTPDDLLICILSRARSNPNFVPPRDIDPNTIKVNGVALPDPSTFTQVPDLDGDGIPDACFIFTPRSLLNLQTSTTTLDVTARTISTSPLGGGLQYAGSAAIQVTGGGGGGGGGGLPVTSAAPGSFFFNFVPTPPPFSGKLPRPFVLSRLRYKPLPINVAFRQFIPARPFAQRLYDFNHPTDQHNGTGSKHEGSKANTLGYRVFNRGRYKPGQFIRPIHHHPGGLRTIPPTLR
ncbi:MAG: integrin alpha [Isosphaeraceae bacterium]